MYQKIIDSLKSYEIGQFDEIQCYSPRQHSLEAGDMGPLLFQRPGNTWRVVDSQGLVDLYAVVPLSGLTKAFEKIAEKYPWKDVGASYDGNVFIPKLFIRILCLGLSSPDPELRDKAIRELSQGLKAGKYKRLDFDLRYYVLRVAGAYPVLCRYSNGDLLDEATLGLIAAHSKLRPTYIKAAVIQGDTEAFQALKKAAGDPTLVLTDCTRLCAEYGADEKGFIDLGDMTVEAYAARMVEIINRELFTDDDEFALIRQLFRMDLDDQAKYAIMGWMTRFNVKNEEVRYVFQGKQNPSRMNKFVYYVRLSKPDPERMHDLIANVVIGELGMLAHPGRRFSQPELVEMCWERYKKKRGLKTDLQLHTAITLGFLWAFQPEVIAQAPSGDMILKELFDRGGGKAYYESIKNRKLRTQCAARVLSL